MTDQAVRDLTAILGLGSHPASQSGHGMSIQGNGVASSSAAATASAPAGSSSYIQRASHIFFPTYEQHGVKEAREKR
eukprot:6122362-Pyramimonas_sp.AAC.1